MSNIVFIFANRNTDLWCSGNTSDFDSLIPGSNPGRSSKKEKKLT